MKNRRLSASKFENPEISELNDEIKRLTNDLISAKDRN